MHKTIKQSIASFIRPEPEEKIWEWAEQNIIFEAPYKALANGPYDSSVTPFWREPMECMMDKSIREIWILKCTQSGGSENVLLMPMRYAVCRAPQTVIYIGGQQKATEEYMIERIKPGLKLSPELRYRWGTAREMEHQIYYPDMMIVAGWSKSTDIFKQRPVDLALADEVDEWPLFSADKLRRRFTTRPFAKLAGISSLDAKKNKPTAESPIWIEYQQTDERKYFFPDPKKRNKKTQKWFRLEMGWKDRKSGRECPYGLKWSPDAKTADGIWDVDIVAESAYYVTPWGTIITDDMKKQMLEDGLGRWQPTRKCLDRTKRGYHLSALYLHWRTFGEIARDFLQALERGKQALRVFIYEDLAEEWLEEIESPGENEIQDCQGEYRKGQKFSESDGICDERGQKFQDVYIKKKKTTFITVDVQKGYGYWLAREWIEDGDSGLIDCGIWHDWTQLDKIASVKDGFGASRVLVDAAYGERTQEVYQACYKYRFIPTMGKENIKDLLFTQGKINPFEGTRRQKERHSIGIIYFRTEPFKTQLMNRIQRKTEFAWYVYHGIELEYADQVTSEERKDGVWVLKRGRTQNHFWDCEVLQLLAATRFGYNYYKGFRERPESTE
jgi:hypothetical protein